VNFNEEMNGVTRFMLAIGLTDGRGSGIHIASAASATTALAEFSHLKIGSSVSLDTTDFHSPPVSHRTLDSLTFFLPLP
jgi:hypothetical protein